MNSNIRRIVSSSVSSMLCSEQNIITLYLIGLDNLLVYQNKVIPKHTSSGAASRTADVQRERPEVKGNVRIWKHGFQKRRWR